MALSDDKRYNKYSTTTKLGSGYQMDKVKNAKLLTDIRTPYNYEGMIDVVAFDHHVEDLVD